MPYVMLNDGAPMRIVMETRLSNGEIFSPEQLDQFSEKDLRKIGASRIITEPAVEPGQHLTGTTYEVTDKGTIGHGVYAPWSADDWKAAAKAALEEADIVALRTFKAGKAYPKEWNAYEDVLRQIVSTGRGPLPHRPDWP